MSGGFRVLGGNVLRRVKMHRTQIRLAASGRNPDFGLSRHWGFESLPVHHFKNDKLKWEAARESIKLEVWFEDKILEEEQKV
jgi:hypothetical protein